MRDKQPQPVLNTAVVAGLITSVAAVCGTFGFTSAETKLSGAAQTLAALVVGVVILLGHVVAALHVRQQVTPTGSPHDGAGRRLVPTGGFHPTEQPFLGLAAAMADLTNPTGAEIQSSVPLEAFSGTVANPGDRSIGDEDGLPGLDSAPEPDEPAQGLHAGTNRAHPILPADVSTGRHAAP